MPIRLLTEQERPLAEDLWDYCFEKRTDPFFGWYFSRYCRTQNILGAFRQERLAGMVHLNPYTLLLNNEAFPVSYLVGVAVAPEHRRQGVLRDMLAAAFDELAARGQTLAILQPIAAGLYNKHGFAYCYYRLQYDLPLAELAKLPRPPRGYDFSAAAAADWPYLQAIYRDFSAAYNGKINRGKERWLNILGEAACGGGGRCVLAYAGGQAQGYLLYALKDNCFHVIEMSYRDSTAKWALLSFAAQHSSQCASFSWLAPPDDLTFLEFQSGGYYPVYRPFMMARIINPAATVARLQLPPPPVDIRLAITDSIIKENNAIFNLGNDNGLAALTPVNGVPQTKLAIGSFAQLCFGAHSPDSLRAASRLEINDPAVLDALRAVFPGKLNYINEYF